MLWWDQELLLFSDQEVIALMPGIHTLSLFIFEGIRMEGSQPGHGIVLEWSEFSGTEGSFWWITS